MMDFQDRDRFDTAPIGGESTVSSADAFSATETPYNTENIVNEEPAAQPYSTPYQTPVREEAGMPQYHTQPAFEPGTSAYSTYQEWEEQNRRRGRRKKAKKPRSRKPLIAVLAVILAVAVFAGGVGVGSLIAVGKQVTTSAAQNVPQPQNKENLPSLGITATPNTSAAPAAGAVLTGEQVYEKCVPSMVAIQSGWLGLGSAGEGSGVIMTADGYIITNAHVVLDDSTSARADKVTVVLHDGTNLPASIIGADENTDLAVLKVSPESPLSAAEFGDSDALKPGQSCYAIG